jgi:diaminopimelate decarboxylase
VTTGSPPDLVAALAGVLPDTACVNEPGHLALGGCDLVELADRFGTPLYVYDEATIRGRARAYREALTGGYPGESRVCYAAKAYWAPWLVPIVADEDLGLDVVSGGELFVARHGGFPAERIYFHGNNKGEDELREALSNSNGGVGCVVVDNMEEIGRLALLARARAAPQRVMLRVTPAVEAHTHAHIKTGIRDTKFGLSLESGAAEAAARAIAREPGLRLVGVHAHIGSQIQELEPFVEAIRRLAEFAVPLWRELGLPLEEFSPGGGFGMRYTPADASPSPAEVARCLGRAVATALAQAGLDGPWPRFTIEPGRSIVGPAGVALYRVGSVKELPGVRTYVAVDGGMADNMRPTTYGAVYSALLANRARAEPDATVAVAGKYCESGDVLIREAWLPRPRVGDLVAVPGSGAYNLAMASNYNLALRPAVVLVRDGAPRLVRRRETYADLLLGSA